MSRWLKSVNTILEKLDDRVETVAEDASSILVDSDGVPVGNLTSRLLGGQQASMKSDDESYYDEEEDYDDEEGYEEVSHDQIDDIGDPSPPPTPSAVETAIGKSEDTEQTRHAQSDETQNYQVRQSAVKNSDEIPPTDSKTMPTHDPERTQSVNAGTHSTKSITPPAKESPHTAATPESTNRTSVATKTSRSTQSVPRPPASAERRPPPAPRSSNASYRSELRELQKLQQEVQKLNKQNNSLQSQLTTAHAELNAQNRELEQAAERLEEDRQLADEEREDLLEEHEDALDTLKESYEARLQSQKQDYENKLADVKHKLATETHMRVVEGGDMTQELEDAIERERQALQKVDLLQRGKMEVEQMNLKMKTQEEALRTQIHNLTESAQAAAEREQQAEERLDSINVAHQRALNQRQTREAELERTVAELGTALANHGKVETIKSNASESKSGEDTVHQRQYDMAVEELESTKGQLSLANQRCEALQNELKLLSRERTDEAESHQQRQREHDRRVESLTSKIGRLENSLREYKAISDDEAANATAAPEAGALSSSSQTSNANLRKATHDLDKARRQIATLSDQLLRQQGMTESAKSEALAFRGRLQSATSRAEAAEQASADAANGGAMYERDSGGVAYARGGGAVRKRVKIGRGAQRGGRTMRSALGLHSVDNEFLEQVAHTVDGLDLWMMETGNIMKYEPLARLGLLVYLIVVHLWCFGLVFFHGIESEHHDLGSLTSRRAVLDMAHHQNQVNGSNP